MPGTLEGRDGAFLDRIEPADRTSISSALTAGGVISATVKLLESPGSGRNGWWDFHARAFRAPQGGLQRAVGVIRDVTVQHELEEELRRASVVFRSSGEGILILDAEGRIIAVNPAFNRLTGYDATDAIGLDPDAFYARREVDSFHARLQCRVAPDHWSGEMACRRRDGSIFRRGSTFARCATPASASATA